MSDECKNQFSSLFCVALKHEVLSVNRISAERGHYDLACARLTGEDHLLL